MATIGPRRNVTLVDSSGLNSWTVNSEGRADVVQHSHIDNSLIQLSVSSIGGTTERYIMVDLSDITSFFNHKNTNYLHLENLSVNVDAAANAAYTLSLGFLENVDASNGDFFEVKGISGTKATGTSKDIFVPWYPNGPRCRSQSVVTNNITRNNSAYQTDTGLPTVTDPTTRSTAPGNNDLVLEVTVTAQSIAFGIDFSYHSH